ncbi:MAG: GNAT family protein [Candidatus Omnitrophica bacterium]|nr:GNAT family protein [Candidatus Omnitrophota bacterium]
MKSVFLEGKQIYLRAIEKGDVKGNYPQWLNDREVCRNNAHGRFPNSAAKAESYVDRVNNSGSDLVLAIVSKKNDRHIGNIALHGIDWIARNGEFAIIIGEKKYWGRGIAKEASGLLLRHAFLALNLHRVYCGTNEKNIAMQGLAAHMGMKKEGRRRQAFLKDGAYQDIIEYGILRDEYMRRKKAR